MREKFESKFVKTGPADKTIHQLMNKFYGF